MLTRRMAAALTLAMATVGFAQETDVHDLQENLPVRVTDAFASSGPQVQGRTLVSRDRPGGTQAEFEPQLQWGFAPGWHVQLAGVLLASSREDNTNSGDLNVLVFRQLNKANGRRPVFAVSTGVDMPTGKDSAGLDTRLRGIVTQSISTGAAQDRVHGNVEWLHNAKQREDERRHVWLATVGYSRVVRRGIVMILDVARLQQRAFDSTINLAEAGVRGSAFGLVLSCGAGIGLGPQSPKVQFTLGFERSQ